jgi:hypothetical protein
MQNQYPSLQFETAKRPTLDQKFCTRNMSKALLFLYESMVRSLQNKSGMKAVFYTLCLLLFSALPTLAEDGPITSGGGNFQDLKLNITAQKVLASLRQYSEQFPEVKTKDLEATLRQAKLTLADEPLILDGKQVDAKNFPATGEIRVNKQSWEKMQSNPDLLIAFLSHEIFSLMRLESTGHYYLSSRLAILIDPNLKQKMEDVAHQLAAVELGRCYLLNQPGKFWASGLVQVGLSGFSGTLQPDYYPKIPPFSHARNLSRINSAGDEIKMTIWDVPNETGNAIAEISLSDLSLRSLGVFGADYNVCVEAIHFNNPGITPEGRIFGSIYMRTRSFNKAKAVIENHMVRFFQNDKEKNIDEIAPAINLTL